MTGRTRRPYNGFTPAERSKALPIIRAAFARGDIVPETSCSVCRRTFTKPVGQHSEDYRRPLDYYPVCRRCHRAIHMRFWEPERWRAYIGKLDPDGWFQHLRLDLQTLSRPFDESYPDGLPILPKISAFVPEPPNRNLDFWEN